MRAGAALSLQFFMQHTLVVECHTLFSLTFVCPSPPPFLPLCHRRYTKQNSTLGTKLHFIKDLSMSGVDPEWVDKIPGSLGNRLTPLGELEWIFTAIMDAIAWSTLPLPLFQKLFRGDLLVAKLFRNFLLADRILR